MLGEGGGAGGGDGCHLVNFRPSSQLSQDQSIDERGLPPLSLPPSPTLSSIYVSVFLCLNVFLAFVVVLLRPHLLQLSTLEGGVNVRMSTFGYPLNFDKFWPSTSG